MLTRNPRQSILGQRSLETYVQSIFLIDRGSFENPQSYLDRNEYFFLTCKPAAPPATTTAVSTIPEDAIQEAAAAFIANPAVKAALTFWDANPDNSVSGLWQNLFHASQQCNDAINGICRQRAAESATSEPVEKSREYKDWVKTMHAHLRQKLTYGVPSPSTGLVMAVLGYEECSRRLKGP